MKRIFIKPRIAGTIVRNPLTKIPLKDEGQEVTESTYWRRRLFDGDVVKTKKIVQAPPVIDKDKNKK